MDSLAGPSPTRRRRLRHELTEYGAVALYLFVCFAAVLSYRASLLPDAAVGPAPLGLAAVKALILGKFVLLGNAARVGERLRRPRLIARILVKSVALLVVLAVLSVVEALIAGLLHGRGLTLSLGEFGGTWPRIAAECLLLWLILLPYCGIRQVGAALGEGRLRQLLFARG